MRDEHKGKVSLPSREVQEAISSLQNTARPLDYLDERRMQS